MSPRSSINLEGAAAVVTGAGRGIGFSIACGLRGSGASVMFNDRVSNDTASRYIEADYSGKSIFHQGDIRDNHQVEDLISRAVSAFGRIDILVNNAGVDPTRPLLDVDERMWYEVMDTNLKGAFFCAQRAAQQMRRQGKGRIINISSVHGFATMPGFSVYSASKGAINALTREMALELAPYGITVNAIAPGAIEVERFLQNPLYDRTALETEIPTGRVGKPDDISGIVTFLCSDDAEWLTGQIICVDGGTLTRLYLYAGRPIPSGAGKQPASPDHLKLDKGE